MTWLYYAAFVVGTLVVLWQADKGRAWAQGIVRVVIFLTVLSAALRWLSSGILRGDWLTSDALMLLAYAWLGLIKVGAIPPLIPWLAARRARRQREQARDSAG